MADNPHSNCWLDDALDGKPCRAGDPATCPARAAAQRRQLAKEGSWHPLELRAVGGGARLLLVGNPVHCGAALELQARASATDEYGEYSVVQQRGRCVRFELEGRGDTLDVRARLHLGIDGHEFVAQLEPWMRFRWPRQS